MPIYAYRCNECGFSQDILQKMSDPILTVCPSCGKSQFKKQVTAAGFQLKGSGWYATDFKGSGSAPSAAPEAAKQESKEAGSAESTTSSATSTSSDSTKTQSSSPAESGSSAKNSPAE